MSNTNLTLWNKLSTEVDPRFLNPYICEDGTELTAISHIHGRNAMTEIFGPCGTGWGYQIAEVQKIGTYSVLKVKMWYKPHFYNPEIPQTELAYVEEFGSAVQPGKEAFKTMVSSALNRCFMALGHAAGLYSGFSDDHRDVSHESPPAPETAQHTDSNPCVAVDKKPASLPAFDAPLDAETEMVLENMADLVVDALEEPRRHVFLDLIDAFGLHDVKVEYCAFLPPGSPNLDPTYNLSSQMQLFFKRLPAASDFLTLADDATVKAFFSTEDEQNGQHLVDTLGFQSKNGVYRRVMEEEEAYSLLRQGQVGACNSNFLEQ